METNLDWEERDDSGCQELRIRVKRKEKNGSFFFRIAAAAIAVYISPKFWFFFLFFFLGREDELDLTRQCLSRWLVR